MKDVIKTIFVTLLVLAGIFVIYIVVTGKKDYAQDISEIQHCMDYHEGYGWRDPSVCNHSQIEIAQQYGDVYTYVHDNISFDQLWNGNVYTIARDFLNVEYDFDKSQWKKVQY